MFIIDLQGFQYDDSEFVIKEIAILDTRDGGTVHHAIFNRPIIKNWFTSTIKEHLDWTTKNIHGLDYHILDNTYLPYEKIYFFIKNIVREENIFVKDIFKKQVLDKILFKNNNIVTDMTAMGCPSFTILTKYHPGNKFHCKQHTNNNLKCAHETVNLLYLWYVTNK